MILRAAQKFQRLFSEHFRYLILRRAYVHYSQRFSCIMVARHEFCQFSLTLNIIFYDASKQILIKLLDHHIRIQL